MILFLDINERCTFSNNILARDSMLFTTLLIPFDRFEFKITFEMNREVRERTRQRIRIILRDWIRFQPDVRGISKASITCTDKYFQSSSRLCRDHFTAVFQEDLRRRVAK